MVIKHNISKLLPFVNAADTRTINYIFSKLSLYIMKGIEKVESWKQRELFEINWNYRDMLNLGNNENSLNLNGREAWLIIFRIPDVQI